MNILITGGGTGGHLYPGLTMAEEFAKEENNTVFYIASLNGVDQSIIEAELKAGKLQNIAIDFWDLNGFQRQITPANIVKNTKTIGKLINCNIQARQFLKKENIDLVIGVGGYISYPLLKQAVKLGIKTIIHEQNSYPGLVNRKLGKIVDGIGLTYHEAEQYFDQKKTKFVANPRVDKALEHLGKDYSKELGLKENKPKILFLGGSLGADKINNLYTDFIKLPMANDYQCILISGIKNNELSKSSESVGENDHLIIEHTSELLKYIATADFVISRGGATTLLEIVYLEKPALIIPSPNVVANHQEANAKEFANQHLVHYINEKNLTPSAFNEAVDALINDKILINNLQKFVKINSMNKIKEMIKDLDDN